MSEIPGVGDRIELIHTSDKYTRLRRGDTGTVDHITRHPSSATAIGVRWDTGSALMLLAGVDEWRVMPKLRAVE